MMYHSTCSTVRYMRCMDVFVGSCFDLTVDYSITYSFCIEVHAFYRSGGLAQACSAYQLWGLYSCKYYSDGLTEQAFTFE